VVVSAGQRHDSAFFDEALESVSIPPRFADLSDRERPPTQAAADKAYRSAKIRERLQERGVEPVIPRKSHEKANPDETFDKEAYKRRNVVERCVSWLKECRRVATRYEKLGVNFLAMVRLAMIQRYLRIAVAPA
jgi:transposase